MFWLLRTVLFIRVRVSREEAIRLARQHCEAKGWAWCEPVSFSLNLRAYRFMTKCDCRGGNIFGAVDARTGAVRARPPTPR